MDQVRRAVDGVCDDFPADLQVRGVNRGYFDYLWYTEQVARLMVRPAETYRVLDLGAGAGIVPLALSRLGVRAVVLDTFAEYADEFGNQVGTREEILDRYHSHGIPAVLGTADAGVLPFASQSMDIVTFFAVIEHLHQSPRAVLEDIYRVVKPGGAFIVTTPNIGWVRTRLRLLGGRTVHFPVADWFDPPKFFGHIREYTLPELAWMVERAGFTVEAAKYGNRTHLATRERNNPDHWQRRFTVNSLKRFVEAGAIGLAALWPSMRYNMMVIGRKAAA